MKKSIAKTFFMMLILVVSSPDLSAQTRIRFARGRTSTSASGRIGGGGARSYVLAARYGQNTFGKCEFAQRLCNIWQRLNQHELHNQIRQ